MSTEYTYNPATPFDMTVIESADGLSVIVTVITAAPGGVIAQAPCAKSDATTVVCPRTYAPSNFVTGVEVWGTRGDNELTADVPTLHLRGLFGGGNDIVSVDACTTSYVSGGAGNDTLLGGVGQNQFDAGYGEDFIDIDDGAYDVAYCGSSAIESPVDIVDADATDYVSTNCQSVY